MGSMRDNHVPLFSRSVTRREFLRLSAAFLAQLSLAGCAERLASIVPTTPLPTVTPTIPPTDTPTPTLSPTPTATVTATAQPTPTVVLSPRQRALATHEQERLRRLAAYGPTRTLTALEFHGNNYSLMNGIINMTPVEFERQMKLLQALDVHTVTFEELHGFLDGTIQLPLPSLVLTTDSGASSKRSMPEMIPVLQETGNHFLSFIWTRSMAPDESVECAGDVCWQLFRDAHASGMVSLGTHSESHADFATYKADVGLAELRLSIQEIYDQVGVWVSSISWPFESIPSWADRLQEIGVFSGFGGSTRPVREAYAEWGDAGQWRYHLPRLLPPNPGGFSGRPNGASLEQIVSNYNLP